MLLGWFLYNKNMIVLKLSDNLWEAVLREAGEQPDSQLM